VIAAILGRERVEVTPEAKDHLWSALTSWLQHQSRTDSDRSLRPSSIECVEARAPALLPRGPYGRLLDAEFERLGEGSVQVFETTD